MGVLVNMLHEASSRFFKTRGSGRKDIIDTSVTHDGIRPIVEYLMQHKKHD